MRQNVTGRQWIASEAWTTATVLQTPRFMPYLSGTLGIAIRRGEIPGLRDFLLQIKPDQNDDKNTIVREISCIEIHEMHSEDNEKDLFFLFSF